MNSSNEITIFVKDFQIIKNASLTFIPGLNAIIGQSNNGKSALFRAVKSCIYNEPGQTSIRNGCSSYSVGIQMNNHVVIYQKGKESIYKIDGKIYEKPGRVQLPEVAEALRIKELNLNGSNEQLNFWDQMEKPFLLDRSETDLFRFIVDSGKDNNITKALKTLVSDRQSLSKDITMLEGMIAQSEENIKQYEEKLDNSSYKIQVCNQVIEIGPRIKKLEYLKTSILNYKSIHNNLIKSNNDLYNLNSFIMNNEAMYKDLTSKLNIKGTLESLVYSFRNIQMSLNKSNDFVSKYNKLDISKINEIYNRYNNISSILNDYQRVSGLLMGIKSYSVPEYSDNFNENYDKFNKLKSLINSYYVLANNLNASKNSISNSLNEINSLKEQLNAIGICPTCGRPIHE